MNEAQQHMAQFEALVGTWRISGGAEGTVRYHWLEGGHFLLQDVDLVQDGRQVRGLEVIGRLRPFGEEPSEHVHSRFYDSEGNTLDYVQQLRDGLFRIWAGELGSPIAFTGHMNAEGTELDGVWDYAGQGGYRSVMTRLDA